MANKIVLSTITLVMTGTGSTYPLEAAMSWQPFVQSRAPLSFEQNNQAQPRLDLRSPVEHLQNIRAILNPPIAELAALFEVSRQAIYKWLANDSVPEENKVTRIKELSIIADAFKKAGLRRGGSLLNMKLFEGESLMDLLKTRRPYDNSLKTLITEAKLMETDYERSGLMLSNAPSTNDWLTTLPAYFPE